MKVSEKQLFELLSIAEDSLKVHPDTNKFRMPTGARYDLVQIVYEQLNNIPVDLEVTKHSATITHYTAEEIRQHLHACKFDELINN